jgi:hypothetical protein
VLVGVVIWALVGIVVANASPPNPWVLALAGAGIAVLVGVALRGRARRV